MYLNVVATAFLCCHFGVHGYIKETKFMKISLSDSMTAYFSHSLNNTTSTKCGVLCASVSGCRTFYFDSESCYVLTRDYTGLGTVLVSNIYLDLKLKEECTTKGYTPYVDGLYCVKPFTVQKNYQSAREACELDGGRLLILRNEDYNVKLEAVKVITGRNHWLGGSDLDKDGVFTWSDGSPVTTDVSRWSTNNPDNYLNSEYAIQSGTAFRLNDDNENDGNTFICEIVF